MKTILLFVALFMGVTVQSQISFVGFENTMCPDSLSISYTYENYKIGSHGHGYRIFRDGEEVFDKNVMFGPMNLVEMIFINDSTGFISEFDESGHTIYKTENYGDNWASIGGGAPEYLGLFIVNKNTGYLLTWYSQYFYLERVSDIENKSILINNPVIYDTTLLDTIFGDPLCNETSLEFKLRNGTDTIKYTINFIVSPLVNVDSYYDPEYFQVYPNPADDILFVISDGNLNEHCILNIYDFSGRNILACNSVNLKSRQSTLAI